MFIREQYCDKGNYFSSKTKVSNMSYDMYGMLPVNLAPRDGSHVKLVGLYPNGWTQEQVCRWNEEANLWEGWKATLEPTHYFISISDK